MITQHSAWHKVRAQLIVAATSARAGVILMASLPKAVCGPPSPSPMQNPQNPSPRVGPQEPTL